MQSGPFFSAMPQALLGTRRKDNPRSLRGLALLRAGPSHWLPHLSFIHSILHIQGERLMNDLTLTRKDFLKSMAGGFIGASLPAVLWKQSRAAPGHERSRPRFFQNPEDYETLEALADHLIPPDTNPDGLPSPTLVHRTPQTSGYSPVGKELLCDVGRRRRPVACLLP